MALRIPAGEAGIKWRQQNVNLVTGADGLLAPITTDSIDLVTGRGSHGTAALRLAKFGGRSVHPQLAGPDGQVSLNKLLEKQPSWREPIEKGLCYRCLPGELELAVPGLLACLSRGGNASHDVYRQQTVLQLCNRIHLLYAGVASTGKEVDEEWVVTQACVGNGGAAFVPKCRQLLDFVKAWSGGKHAHLLSDLELYERACPNKRKLFTADFQALATVDLLHAPKYVGATRSFLAYIC
jgi:hypothetical protein